MPPLDFVLTSSHIAAGRNFYYIVDFPCPESLSCVASGRNNE